jgi:PAS domain S-box-containing protein
VPLALPKLSGFHVVIFDRYKYLQKTVLVLFACIPVSFAVICGWHILEDRNVTQASNLAISRLMTDSLAEHLSATLRDTTNTVYAAADYIESNQALENIPPEKLNQLLAREALDTTSTFDIFASDKYGILRGEARRYPAPGIRLAKTPEYRYHSVRERDRGILVSQPRLIREFGKWMIPVSRAIYDKSGAFNGMVTAFIDLRYFQSFYQTLAFGDRSEVLLLDEDGSVLFRFPFLTEDVGRYIKSELPADVLSAGPVSILMKSPLDDTNRFTSFRRMPQHGLIVAVGIDEQSAMADWRERSRETAAMFTIALVFFVIVCVIANDFNLRSREVEHRMQLVRTVMHEAQFELEPSTGRISSTAQLPRLFDQPRDSWGRTLKEILGALPPVEAKRLLRAGVRLLRKGTPLLMELSYVRGADHKVFLVTANLVAKAKGKGARIYGAIWDLTAVRSNQLQFTKLAKRYEAFFEKSNEGIALLQDGIFVEANPRFAKLLGVRDVEALLGRAVWDFGPRLQPDGNPTRLFAAEKLKLAQMGIPVGFTCVARQLDGSELTLELSLSEVTLDATSRVLVYARDSRMGSSAQEETSSV